MSLSSASTDDEVWDAYDDNASYEESGDRTKALAFITACRIILRRRPAEMSRGGAGTMSVTFESIREEMNSARAWLAANPGTTRDEVRFASFENFRDH